MVKRKSVTPSNGDKKVVRVQRGTTYETGYKLERSDRNEVLVFRDRRAYETAKRANTLARRLRATG